MFVLFWGLLFVFCLFVVCFVLGFVFFSEYLIEISHSGTSIELYFPIF